jgi:hypothetical protein
MFFAVPFGPKKPRNTDIKRKMKEKNGDWGAAFGRLLKE